MATVIDGARDFRDLEDYKVGLAKLEVIAVEQISTADDALADWRDIVPEDVEELYRGFPLHGRREAGND